MATTLVNFPKPHYIETNGIKLHVMIAGPSSGEPVILLHGFPEFWFGWHQQIEPLAEQGYRVIVPDQRGYNKSDKPAGVKAYRVEELVADVIGLIDALGYDKVRLVGHDWGGAVAWATVLAHPQRVQQLVIANLPHPTVFYNYVRSRPEQMLKSWYIGFFQLGGLAETALSANHYAVMANELKKIASLREVINRYQDAWSQTGALTAMLNWYRAVVQYMPALPADDIVEVETLILWGKRDAYLSHHMAQPSVEKCPNGKLILFELASHFVQHDAPMQFNRHLLDFFSKGNS